MRKQATLVLLSAAVLIGCGGGGSSSTTDLAGQVQSLQLGLLRGDAPTTVPMTVAKPTYKAGTFELAEPAVGAFHPAAGMLPMSVQAGPDAQLWIEFTPPVAPASDVQEGTIRLRFVTVAGAAVPVTLNFQARIEAPSARLLATDMSAGNTVVGETKRFGLYFENTSAATPVTVSSVSLPGGDFSLAPDAFPLPALVGPGSRLFFRLQYAPQSLGSASSLLRVFHSAGSTPLEATLTGTGVDKPSVRLEETDVPAGNVVVGEAIRINVIFENTSLTTPVTVTGVTGLGGEFALAPDAPILPVEVGPGATLSLPVLYTPQGEWDASSLVFVHHSAAAEPLEATVRGTGVAPRLFFSYDIALDASTFESDWVTVDVPAEGVSLFLEATGDPFSLIDLIGLEGPSGTVYESLDMTGPLDWMSSYPAGGRGYLTLQLPDSDLPEVQLESGGGAYRFRLRDSAFAIDKLQVRVTVVQRTGGTVEEGTLNLRVFLSDSVAMDPSTNAKLTDALKTVDAVLGMNDIRLGSILFTSMDPAYDAPFDETATEEMIASNTGFLEEGALNLFFVADLSYGIAGVAGAVPGPRVNGTPFSGVVIDFNEADGITVGAMAAHEIAHYLGHFDPKADGVLLAPGEAYPVLRHPLLNPGLPQELLSPPETTDEAEILAAIDLMPAPDAWCGTFTRTPAR